MNPNYDRNVFINCPFDPDYNQLLPPLLFCVVYFDYQPRISLEISDSGQLRLDKIIELILASKYSIHDLSRIRSTKSDEYFRLNMPFEFGIDHGIRKTSKKHKTKQVLVLEASKYEYQKGISDINGMDIAHHNNSVEDLIKVVRDWFASTVKVENLLTSSKIYNDYMEGFNVWLFDTAMLKYKGEASASKAEAYAVEEVAGLTVPEYIKRAQNWVSLRKTA